jgi:RNA polymerase sigma factor (sigma-70 family)
LDKTTLHKIKNGDQQAFRLLVNQYQHMVYTLCYQITQHKQDAEEATQDTFVKVFLSIKTYQDKSKLSSWIYRIGYNTAISKCRLKKLDATAETPEIQDHNLEKQIEEHDHKNLVSKALQFLHPNERGLIVMFYLEELSVKEISEITGVTRSNLKVILHRSRKKLKEILTTNFKKEIQWIKN